MPSGIPDMPKISYSTDSLPGLAKGILPSSWAQRVCAYQIHNSSRAVCSAPLHVLFVDLYTMYSQALSLQCAIEVSQFCNTRGRGSWRCDSISCAMHTVLSFLWQVGHLKCLAFWCCMRVASSLKTLSQ